MDPATLLADYHARLIGQSIRARRLAGNSLLVYVDGEPGNGTGLTLWFEPTWHLRDRARVLAGSRQAQHEPDAPDPDAGFRAVAEAVDALVGQPVAALAVDAVTGDLRLDTAGGLTLCTFVSDPSDDHLWHIRDNATRLVLQRGGSGWEIRAPDV